MLYISRLLRCRTSTLSSFQLRKLSQLPSSRSGTPTSQVDRVADISENIYATPTLYALDYFKRFAKFSVIGLIVLAGTTGTAFEAAHLWVEHVELSPEEDEQLDAWGWADDAERWTGGDTGGTDRALGLKARHAVRSAWIAQHWGTGSRTLATSSINSKINDTGALSAVDAPLVVAHDFLGVALNIALEKQAENRPLRPQTVTELLTRHANILERMGTRSSLLDARSDYERVWALAGAKGLDAARTAWRLGDLNSRIGDAQEASEWWNRAIILSSDKDDRTAMSSVQIPTELPTSPRGQRILAATLCSLSAYYAQTGELKQARATEESALKLLVPPNLVSHAPSSHSAPRALHDLYIYQRASLLSLHLAEVSYALKDSPIESLNRLRHSANISEQIVHILTGTPTVHTDATQSALSPPPVPESPVHGAFAKSRTLQGPASNLLRDARRTAIEAWTLAGHLHEIGVTGTLQDALDCYERALGWASVSVNEQGGIGQAGSATLEKEWQGLWNDYVRVRDCVRKGATDPRG